jgi:two-component system OmpR family response regulator
MKTDVSTESKARRTVRPAILLAEDDDDMRTELARWLQREGYAVRECRNGAQLLDELAGYFEAKPGSTPGDTFDLIISDIRMPGIFGSTVADGARDIPGFPPTILITAFGSDETHEAARHSGVEAVFDKPFAMKDLLQKVREILSRSSSPGPPGG